MSMLSNQEIREIALRQSAIDLSCAPEDFCRTENVVVVSKQAPDARKYLSLPFFCDLVSYGGNVVASVHPDIEQAVTAYINRFQTMQCFETPNILLLEKVLRSHGYGLCFMAEYFLPDIASLQELNCGYEMKCLAPVDFAELYLPEWQNALCEKRKQLDVLAVGAYDGDRLVGLAGCSADCDEMWQIGIDVLPAYRQQGIASALTSKLAVETVKRSKVPFYCAAWSNVASVRNAVKSGFRPAWVELTAKKDEEIEQMLEGRP